MTVGTSYVSAEFKVTSLSTAGDTLRVLASGPEAQSENGHSGDCQDVLDSVVRCVTNQILSYRPSSDRAFLSTMLVLSDVLAFLKPNFNSYPC